eukprot:gene28362-31489_t
MMEITGSIRIINAMSLPKVEALSKIDAYVVLKQNGAVIGKTKAVDNNEDPVWNQAGMVHGWPVGINSDIFAASSHCYSGNAQMRSAWNGYDQLTENIILYRDAHGKVHGNIDVMLYDENNFKGRLVFPVVLHRDAQGKVHGNIDVILYDEDTFKDKLVFPVVLHRDAQGKVHGNIDVILYDENTFKDKLVGSVSLDLSKLSPQQLLHQEVAIGFAENKFAKQGKNSRMGITITPGVLAYNSMRAMWGALPGVKG